jgi:hypothetical protein
MTGGPRKYGNIILGRDRKLIGFRTCDFDLGGLLFGLCRIQECVFWGEVDPKRGDLSLVLHSAPVRLQWLGNSAIASFAFSVEPKPRLKVGRHLRQAWVSRK